MCLAVCMLKMLEASHDPNFLLGGEGNIVEINEAKFGRRKLHQGRQVEGIWVFGALQRRSETSERRMFMCAVHDRTADTLIPIITKWIKPSNMNQNITDTKIISDGWASYLQIEAIENKNYMHEVVIHHDNFVDPDTGAHANNIEGGWRWTRNFMPLAGTRKWLYDTYIWDMCYRYQFLDGVKGECVHTFLSRVREIYDPHWFELYFSRNTLETQSDFLISRPIDNEVN
ncbi:hypothetical protein RF11_13554 [Thelohanellus kitauei]|uniref:ISXO2-like transposase domain-containing protein n=1 Tax=Thelohanellus kitauei TaxID=669202 RepID=A0A0C2MNX1_THEKT|nr:hypothetical protein RF11_13554 [Thelohanellus kitauei]